MMHELPKRKSVWKPSSRRDRHAGCPHAVWFAVLFVALAVSSKAAEPVVSVSVNGKGSSVVFPGMPLLISGVFVSSGAGDCGLPPVLLAAGQGPWTSAVTLEIRSAAGDLQTWPLHTLVTPSNSIALDCAVYAQIDWWLTPGETSLLSTGSYTIDLVLNTTNAVQPGAWKGIVEAVPAELSLVSEPAPLSEAQAENKYGQLGQYDLFVESPLDALNQVNQLLALYPTNLAGLRLKAEVLDRLGRAAEALAVCRESLAEFYRREPTPPEPPGNLMELRRRLEDELLAPMQLSIQLAGSLLTLRWSSVPNVLYEIQTSQDLRQWSAWARGLQATNTSYRFETNVSAARQFFRVVR
jgi:hypothetical protein